MTVTKEQAGTYRQIADILRWRRADRSRVESVRPGRTEKDPEYTDSIEKPTLIELKEGDEVDVETMLRQRAIARVEKAGKGPRATTEEKAPEREGG